VKQDSSAPKVETEAPEIRIVPRLLHVRESAWARRWVRVQALARDERCAEFVLVAVTFLLATLLLASLDHALQHPQFSAPPHLPVWVTQLPQG
jgi:hypothetical protein